MKEFEVVKTGFNVWEFRYNGITYKEGSKTECEAFKKGFIAEKSRSGPVI